MRKSSVLMVGVSALFAFACIAQSAVIDIPGTTVPQSATAGLLITASGGETVDSFQFDILTTNGAIATDIDMTGSFLSGGTVQKILFDGDETYPRFQYVQGGFPTTTAEINGTVGTLIIDTSSLPVGSTFTVDFFAAFNETKFSRAVEQSNPIDTYPSPSGPFTITVVPEPAVLGGMLATGLLALRRRRA